MAEKRIHVGVFTEAGGAHLGAYFEALAEIEECENVVVCDPSGDAFNSARKALGEKLAGVYGDPGKLLAEARPELAMVSMEAVNAPPVIRRALEAGCHVFAEKPACVNALDFETLVKLAESKDRLLMLALANRITPSVQFAKKLIADGTIGALYGAEIHLVADQTRLTRESYHSTWFADRKRAGGGHLIWLGIHWLDLSMYLTGNSIHEVCGFTANVGGQPIMAEDAAALALRYDNGALGTMTSAYFLDKGYHSHLRLWGSQGWIEYAEWLGTERTPEPLRWYSTAPNHKTDGIASYGGPLEPRGYTPWLRACVRAAAGLEKPPITGREGLRVLRTVFAGYEAAEQGRVVTVET
ncbi:MAG: Gfo/Idh/MocA family oxidoreductase [Verrucomicrobiae bacterium]|nr:Gfo/Idh/MocA family oxidoreductase [Verrucomicrobiae bacterium]